MASPAARPLVPVGACGTPVRSAATPGATLWHFPVGGKMAIGVKMCPDNPFLLLLTESKYQFMFRCFSPGKLQGSSFILTLAEKRGGRLC